ncbi:DUF6207 family protein [Streptomyces sp. NBC_00687]|uniref:DUF6207 family protein n=1 Tax=Streptomyces sp. NBC_00687 TaxID=2975807 RepID=UPI00338FACAB
MKAILDAHVAEPGLAMVEIAAADDAGDHQRDGAGGGGEGCGQVQGDGGSRADRHRP